MNSPILIEKECFQDAWLEAANLLMDNHWDLWNLIIHIKHPILMDKDFNNRVTAFAKEHGLITPKGVAYTIFPHKTYKRVQDAQILYNSYLKTIYPWTRTRAHKGWGTYFYRMINYKTDEGCINQLDNIISAINNRVITSRAAYTIVIEKPGGETIKPLGAPCLNYIAVQLEPGEHRNRIGLLCVYRNHDFLERAYGNYWGLSNLLYFIARETDSEVGTLTCVSSHAYISKKKLALKSFVEDLI